MFNPKRQTSQPVQMNISLKYDAYQIYISITAILLFFKNKFWTKFCTIFGSDMLIGQD